MLVTFDECKLFYELYSVLLAYVNERQAVVPEKFSDSNEYLSLDPIARGKIRNALYDHRELIDSFVADNPAGLPPQQLEIIAGWKDALAGNFYVFRHLQKHTIFLSAGAPPTKAYGVLGLNDPLKTVVGSRPPILCKAALLPLNGRIIYDGLLAPYPITFGSGVRKSLNEAYKQAKDAFGIITSFDAPPAARAAKPKKPKKKSTKQPPKGSSQSQSQKAKAIAEELMQMTDAFCEEFLNAEYVELCRNLAGALARKRPSPLLQGQRKTWASAIVRTIGWVNFLQDPTQTPHMRLGDIEQTFGVAESTGAAKSNTIRKMLKIGQLDPKWTLPSMLDDNPRVWMLQVDGFIVDARYASRDLQVAAFEQGLIPYIPADRVDAGDEDSSPLP